MVNDDAAGIALAVGHLVALGHRAIGHVAGPARISTGRARRAGFAAALKRRRLAAPAVAADNYDIVSGERACMQLLAAYPRLTAIVAANDLLALGCYDALARRGASCPGDVSITGFNDITFADRFSPPLTTVRIPHRVMGEQAARLLLAEIEDPQAPKQEIKLEPALVVRGSTAAPRVRARKA